MRLWDARTGQCTGILGGGGLAMAVLSLAFSPDAATLATATPAGTLWDLKSAAITATLPTQTPFDRVWSVAYCPDGATVASGGMDNYNILVWDTRTGQQRHVLVGHIGMIYALAFSPDDQILASASYDRTVRLWPIHPSQTGM